MDSTGTIVEQVQNLDNLSRSYRDNAQKCKAIGDYLKRQSDSMFWKSKAAEGFRQNMEEYQRTLSNLNMTMTTLSEEVKRRADELRASQNV